MPTRAALNRLGLEKAWFAAIPMGVGSERALVMNLAEDLVFVHTNMGNLHAYEAETGKYRWGAEPRPGVAGRAARLGECRPRLHYERADPRGPRPPHRPDGLDDAHGGHGRRCHSRQ